MDPKLLMGDGDDPWTVLALFGLPIGSEAIRRLFSVARKVIERAGLDVNVLALNTTDRYGRYRRATPRFFRLLESSDVTGFSAAYVPPPQTDAVKHGWILAGAHDSRFVVVGQSDVFTPHAESIVAVVQEIARDYPVKYGYQYVIDKHYGPGFHAVGIFYKQIGRKDLSELSGVEARRTSGWSNRSQAAVVSGALRDVFPLNLLSEVHRRRLINGVPLFEWIAQNSSRGRLEMILPGLWAWHVPEEKCVDLGDTLEAAGLLA